MSNNKLWPLHRLEQPETTDKYLLRKILNDILKSEKQGYNTTYDSSYVNCVCINVFKNSDWENL